MADKPYRFLFRMPEQLRQRLVASAQEHGRSLNSELLVRLERSLVDEARTPLYTRLAQAARSLVAPSWRGVPRIGVAVALGLVVAVVAAGAGRFGSNGARDRPLDGLAQPGTVQVQVPFPAVKSYTPPQG